MDDTLQQLRSIQSSQTQAGFQREIVRADKSSATVTCRLCSAPFEADTINLRHAIRAGTPRFQFCGRSCSRKWWHAQNPGTSAATIAKMNEAPRPSVVPYLRTPVTLAALSRTLRSIGHHPTTRGGNGHVAPCEALVMAAMPDWVPQYVVPLGARRPGCPTHYKLDFALPEKMLDIELDGPSHRARTRQVADEHRDTVLTNLGWTVLRIKNTEILSKSSTSALREYLTSLLAGC